ncbi:hypothetical protein [Rhodococcoides trifolii]|uniref:hypothetical protein n=1 Tax=Rhodococcoides trifolii TaxID=908250 RepID=UPI001666523B|nr:hypothetical protein [Rhodococcus trifolii]
MSERRVLLTSLYGGVGNRIKPLLSSRELAIATDREHLVYWKRDHRFQAKLSQLWNFDVRLVSFVQNAYALKKHPTVTTGQAVTELNDVSWVNARHHDPFEFAEQPRTWEESFRELVPHESIQVSIRTLLSNSLLSGPYVGLMVRAHNQAHPHTKSTSPVSWFVARINQILEVSPDMSFYLSCDDPGTQAELQSQFPSIVAMKKVGRYNSTAGVQEAVADLYLLAQSSYLIGPAWSTFVHMADALRPAPMYRVETPLDPPDVPVDFRSLAPSSSQYSWIR